MTRAAATARRLVLLLGAGAVLALAPGWLAGRCAGRWFDGDRATQDALARSVIAAQAAQPRAQLYRSGADRFDGQSAVAVYQMTILGLGQILLQHPELRDEYLPAMRVAAERLASPATLSYAARKYGQHGVVRMDPGEGHAYLGYINMGLGMLRILDPQTPLARLNDRLSEELARRLDASPQGLIETYPGETWPPDVAAVAGSLGLHARASGRDHTALLERWARRFERCALDPQSGMLVQRVATGSCRPVDAPRGSGTAIAAYFVAFAHPALARRLYEGVTRSRRSVLAFAGVREYPAGRTGRGDLNAGPMVFGLSVGASGFALGAARVHGDREGFAGLYRSAHLLGVPVAAGEGTTFAVGGALGNALLLAMLTGRTP